MDGLDDDLDEGLGGVDGEGGVGGEGHEWLGDEVGHVRRRLHGVRGGIRCVRHCEKS